MPQTTGMFHSTNDLILDFHTGSEKAYNYIYRLYRSRIFWFIHNLIHDTAEAEDITAECFIKLWNRRTAFDNTEKIKSFLFVTAHNASLDYLRRKQVKARAEKELTLLLENEDFVLTRIVKAELFTQIYDEIEKLPLQCKRVFKMLFFESLTYVEVCDQLKIDINTARNQKRRALQLLKNSILKNEILISLLVIWTGLRL
jgi:RNA polymerase sigma-70 factor (ECF subfamily)